MTYYGPEPALPQPRRRHVRGRHRQGRPRAARARAGARAARSSTTTATAGSTSSSRTTSTSTSRPRPRPTRACAATRASPVACGPPGPAGRQERRSTATAATGPSRTCPRRPGITKASGTYGLGVSTLDFDDDGWVDLYVANDSNPSALYRNNRDGTFDGHRRSPRAAPTARTASRRRAWAWPSATTTATARMDIFKTNFAGDTSTLYANTGDGFCEDRTFAGGIGINTRWLGWGVGVRGPRQRRLAGPVPRQRPRLPRGRAAQDRGGLPAAQGRLPQPRRRPVRGRHASGSGRPSPTPKAGRGAAFGDFDNDGDVDVRGQQRPRHARPLPRSTRDAAATGWRCSSWARRSNRSAIGARVRCAARRRHAGRGGARRGQLLLAERPARALRPRRRRARWSASRCAGRTASRKQWTGLDADRILTLTEGSGRAVPARTGRP